MMVKQRWKDVGCGPESSDNLADWAGPSTGPTFLGSGRASQIYISDHQILLQISMIKNLCAQIFPSGSKSRE